MPARPPIATGFVAAALAIRDRIIHRWLASERASHAKGSKRVYYLSLEFLIGRLLSDVLGNLGMAEVFRAALGDLGVDLNRLRSAEPDAALGNGGLGRLAACFMESMASLGIPAYGYGIRYDHGLFRQVIKDGWQQEYPEDWLSFGNPWEFARPEVIYDIHFGGLRRDRHTLPGGQPRYVWRPDETIEAVAYDTPIVGWRGRHVNPLRLWTARAVDPMRLDAFNSGDHIGALVEQSRAEAISKVLYPSDETPAGRELRLRQEYFFVSASLQDLVQRHLRTDGDLHFLPHAGGDPAQRHASEHRDRRADAAARRRAWPAVERGVADHRRHVLLHQSHAAAGGARDLAGAAVRARAAASPADHLPHQCRAYRRRAKHKDPEDFSERLAAISLIDEHGGRKLRMGHLAFVGSHRVNGVSALHTDLMRKTVFRDLHALYPDRIVNKTNGITFRRWLHAGQSGARARCCARSAAMRCWTIPRSIARLADRRRRQSPLQERIAAAKRANKVALSRLVGDRMGLRLDPDALFDVQIKRIHEYKRQLLNILETVATLPRHARRSDTALGAAREDFRRQGGGELHAGQADHQADQRRRQGGQRATRSRAICCGSCSCPTTMSAWPR